LLSGKNGSGKHDTGKNGTGNNGTNGKVGKNVLILRFGVGVGGLG